ncbi:MAG: putative transcriptional regulator [Thermoleophilaceae bacterium]|nr:putative transcriptional regulator [Thermoleophilaceae bacterium]
MDSVRGKLLIASPGLTDFFRRSVVLVLEHSDEGAVGLVLNRPSETHVDEAVPDLAELAEPEDVVHLGGPVGPDSVIVLGRFEDPDEAASIVFDDLGVVNPEAATPDLLAARIFAGHAGWAPGQLDGELEQDAWIVEPAHADDPFEPGDLWSQVLDRKGGGYSLLARMPEDPSLN